MNYRLIILFLILTSCAQNYKNSERNKPFVSKGFAYIYNAEDFENKVIKKKLDNSSFQIAHNKLRIGSQRERKIVDKLIENYFNKNFLLFINDYLVVLFRFNLIWYKSNIFSP